MKVRELIEALQKLDPELPVIQVTCTMWDSDTWTDLVDVKVIPTENFVVGKGYIKEDAVHLIMQVFDE